MMKKKNDTLSIISKKEKAVLFWNWFSENQSKLLYFNPFTSEKMFHFIEAISDELDKYNPSIFFEIGKHPNNDRIQLVITAAGNQKHFPDVELLCSQAPTFENWEIIAFKPAMGTAFLLRYRGIELNPDTIIFIPLENKEIPEAVGIHICFDQLNTENRDVLIGGTYLILDCILGERATTLDIDYLDVIRTPANIDQYDYKYLYEIAPYIEEKKKLKKG